MIAFTSWDIGRYVYCNVLTRLWRHKIWSQPDLSSQSIFLHDLSQGKNLNILRIKKLLRWNKKHFSSFSKGFQLPKVVSHLRVDLKELSYTAFALNTTINTTSSDWKFPYPSNKRLIYRPELNLKTVYLDEVIR